MSSNSSDCGKNYIGSALVLTYILSAGFISSAWHITFKAMFAGSCIGVICLVCILELFRRLGREYDRALQASASEFRLNGKNLASSSSDIETAAHDSTASGKGSDNRLFLGFPQQRALARPTLLQQTVRALLHMVQVGLAYFIMLLAMYYNGYFIICILIGAFIGAFVFSWDLSTVGFDGSSGCCGE